MRALGKNLFVVLEGVSGTGKTTIAKLLTERINGVFYSTPSGDFQKIREKIHAMENIQFLFYFYLSSVIFASEEIKKIIKNKPVICDRYIHTTLCYYQALGLNTSINQVKLEILAPDFIFLLTCNKNIQDERLNTRGRSNHDVIEDRYIQKILNEYRKYHLTKIDTTNLSPNQIVDDILLKIKPYLKNI